MTVATERVFRSDETPKLKLITRNIESVTVRAYKVDLETYFRKMHLARGVEGLDIALIDPDKTFEFKVPKYAKYQELESAVEVPLPGGAHAGVMAVTVSSKTLEATTLVIQSDLDVIVKSSRDEVFVFAENMLTGKPWAGVKLLVSNGKQVFAEGRPATTACSQKSYKELQGRRRRPRLRRGRAATWPRTWSASRASASPAAGRQGLHLHRPAGLPRRAAGQRPRLPAPRGRRRLHDREGQEVHARGLRQPQPAGPPGTGRARTLRQLPRRTSSCRRPARRASTACWSATRPAQNYQGTFQVHEYQLEPVRLVVDTPRRVYYRGEEIEGTIRAEFYYGAPLVGREIRYQLADDRLQTATTDAKGEVHFKLPTREFSETQVLPLVGPLPERNLQTAVNFVLAAQGFSIGVSTVRPVYVAGETFEATRQDQRRRGQAARPEAEAQGAGADHGRGQGRRAARRGAPAGDRRPTARPADAQARQGRAVTSSAPRAPTASTTRSPASAWCRSPTRRTRCGCGSWPTSTPSRWATRPRCSSTGARSRPWPWSRSRGPGCSTTSWSS